MLKFFKYPHYYSNSTIIRSTPNNSPLLDYNLINFFYNFFKNFVSMRRRVLAIKTTPP